MQNIPRPEYPRPQFVRKEWFNLNGEWTYEFDFGNSGLERGLAGSKGFKDNIIVPFCPESRLSGVEHTDFIEHMFYHKVIEIPAEWEGKSVLLHFGAVDYEAEIFIDGKSAGKHFGGSSSFTICLDGFAEAGSKHDLIVKVDDISRSGEQPRGKQCDSFKSKACDYTRTTGIWQTVWMEPAAKYGLESCRITPDLDGKSFVFTPLFRAERRGFSFEIKISADGKAAGGEVFPAAGGIPLQVKLSTVRAWSPEDPFLYDIEYTVKDADGNIIDSVSAYAGLRKIHIEGDKIFLNNSPRFLRLVLDQGFYPEGIWTAPSDADLKKDIELSMAAGFNGARLHQKVFEERYHYWADRLGYLTWGESPSWGIAFGWGACAKNPASNMWPGVFNFMSEWREIVERDANHPSIIAWTPLNETWIGSDKWMFKKIQSSIYDLTKSLDRTRPCQDTSGYHHMKTDLWTVHLYMKDAAELKAKLKPENSPVFMMEGESGYNGQPYINDEFGGFMFIPPHRQKFADNTWGYHGISIHNEDELCAKIREQVELMISMPEMAGFCYTQLTDVEQEQNGLYCYDRTPKVSDGKLKAVFGMTPDGEAK